MKNIKNYGREIGVTLFSKSYHFNAFEVKELDDVVAEYLKKQYPQLRETQEGVTPGIVPQSSKNVKVIATVNTKKINKKEINEVIERKNNKVIEEVVDKKKNKTIEEKHKKTTKKTTKKSKK